MEHKDYYRILNVPRDASQEDIKRAYRKLARKYHPDVSQEQNAEQHFKEIGEAYEVLKDPKQRLAYDRRSRGATPFSSGWAKGFDFTDDGFEVNQDFNFKEFFETLFGKDGHHPDTHYHAFHTRGEDQHARLTITLEEAYCGIVRTIHLQLPDRDNVTNHKVLKTRMLNVKIPAGVIEGQHIRLVGQGMAGAGEGQRGDLYLAIEFQPHSLYRVEERDVYLSLPITPWEAALGCMVSVPTLGGKVELKVPSGSQSGQKLRLKGRGLPGPIRGDQYVILQIVTPQADSTSAEAFYHKMAQEFSFDPRTHLG
jgi:curved DNA-binding protein